MYMYTKDSETYPVRNKRGNITVISVSILVYTYNL